MKRMMVWGLALLVMVGLATMSRAAEKRGSAKEAEQLVKQGMEMFKAKGRDAGVSEINREGSRFVDRDLYLVVIDTEGNTLAHGSNKKLIGKNMLELRDPDGKFFIKEFIELAKSKETGWVDYKITDPITKNIERKSSYVAKYENLIVGCGIYKP